MRLTGKPGLPASCWISRRRRLARTTSCSRGPAARGPETTEEGFNGVQQLTVPRGWRWAGITFKPEIDLAGAAVIVTALFALWALIVARRQLSAMVLQTRATILLALDERWASDKMLSFRGAALRLINEVSDQVGLQPAEIKESDQRSRCSQVYATELQEMRTRGDVSYSSIVQICNFFETVGYTARSNQIPVGDVLNIFGGAIDVIGLVCASHLKKLQEEAGDRRIFENFLWLVTEKMYMDFRVGEEAGAIF